MKKYDSEITALGERIMEYCPDQDIRLEATGRLAFQHCEMGRREIGRAVYETLPSQKSCIETPTLLLDKVAQQKTDFETTDSRTLCEIIAG